MFEPMPPPMSSNPRDQRERSLAWNEEHCELALDPEDTMSTGQNRGERSDVQPSYVYSSHPDYVGDHEPVRSPIAPAPTATSQPGQSIILLLQNASREVAEAKARRAAVADARRKAKEAKRGADSPCFVDECRFVAPRPAHREHLRSEHGIVHLRNKWLLQTAEQWTTVHPFQCPLKSCDVYWKGTPRKTGLQLHIQLSHWLEPQNKLPSGMWTCHLCLGLSPDFSKKFDLIKHLEQSHGFSYILPFNPMDDREEEAGNEVSTSSPSEHANPPYSPSWGSDIEMDEEDEGEVQVNAPVDDGQPTYEANNVADWMDIDTETPDWAV